MEASQTSKPKYRVLILHGWLHSSDCYDKLAKDLADLALVDCYEFPGFGHKTYPRGSWDVLDGYRKNLLALLKQENYDLVLSHSMGGNILLKALEGVDEPPKKLLLSNTAYQGIPLLKPLAWAIPLIYLGIKTIQVLPEGWGKPILKALAQFTINDPRSFKDTLYQDILQAHALVASLSLCQLTYDSFTWRPKKGQTRPWIMVTYSEKDRVIPLKKTRALVQDLRPDRLQEFKNIGHTPVLEAYEDYLALVRKILVG